MVEREGALTLTTRWSTQKPAEAVEPREPEMDGVGQYLLLHTHGVEVHAICEVVDLALVGPGQAVIVAAATIVAKVLVLDSYGRLLAQGRRRRK